MKQITLVMLFTFSLSLVAQAQKTERVKKVKLPSGIVMKDNIVTVSDKYVIKETDGGAQVMYKKAKDDGPGTIGSFQCNCPGEGGGDCKLITTEHDLKCVNRTRSNCRLTVVIRTNRAIRTIQ